MLILIWNSFISHNHMFKEIDYLSLCKVFITANNHYRYEQYRYVSCIEITTMITQVWYYFNRFKNFEWD